jgi:hypothetical protein
MNAFFTKHFGPNWSVKAWGAATALCAFIALNPNSVEFLPDTLEKYVVGMASILTGAGIFGMSAVSKGSKVTGGNVAATPEAKDRVENCKPGEVCDIPRAIPVDPKDKPLYDDPPKPDFEKKDS